MPDFPGVADAEDSSDWDAGMPLDLDRIRDKDEKYWDERRAGTISNMLGVVILD